MSHPEALRLFLRVAELSSFTAAAESLFVPRPKVSKAVQQLEEWVGARLLHRTTRRVELTAEGREFYRRAQQVLEDLEVLGNLFQDPTELKGHLRVDMSPGFAKRVIPHLEDFFRDHPGLKLTLHATDRRVDPVSEGFDLVIRAGLQTEPGMASRALADLEMVNCASPGYLDERGRPTSPEELKHHSLVGYVTNGKAEQATTFEAFIEDDWQEWEMPCHLTVSNSSDYLSAALAGLGIIQVPRVGVSEQLEEGLLEEILVDFRPAPLKLFALYPHERLLPRKTEVFLSWLSERILAKSS